MRCVCVLCEIWWVVGAVTGCLQVFDAGFGAPTSVLGGETVMRSYESTLIQQKNQILVFVGFVG